MLDKQILSSLRHWIESYGTDSLLVRSYLVFLYLVFLGVFLFFFKLARGGLEGLEQDWTS